MANKNINVMDSPGIILDSPPNRIVENAFTSVKNFRFNERGGEIFQGDRGAFSPNNLVPSPTWIYPFPSTSNPKWVYANNSRVFVVEETTHTEITRNSSNYNGSSDQRWHAAFLSGVGILNNTIDIPQAWLDFDSSVRLVDLANWPANTSCRNLKSFKNFLVALDITESSTRRPFRVRWSHPAAPGTVPASWDVGDPSFDSREFDLALTSDYLVDQLVLGEINVIYKETSTWGMQFIGAPNFFRFWKILDGKGLIARDCVVALPKGHFVVTQDDIIIHSGQQNSYQSIVDKRIRNNIFSSINPERFYNSFVFADYAKNEAWFCFPELGEEYATRGIVWNWRENSIGEYSLDSIPFISVGPVGTSFDSDLEWGD